MLKLTGIKKDYITASETVHALKGVDLCFRKNEFVSVLGPSGCGKTTLLNIIGGLDHYTDGDLVINGRSTKFYRDRDWDVYRNHRIGFIFQSYNLIPHQTILGNVELALTIAGIDKEERIARAKEALDKVGLAGQYYKRPNQLSGGQCQRVAIARALVNNPEILLADEPTGALDTVTSTQIMDLVKEISKERLVIMVTHNPELAEEYSSRIIRLLDGQVIEDSNPFSAEDEATEVAELAALAATEEEAKEPETPVKTKTKNKKKKAEKAKMSFFTAFKLSARNLISKKGRTTMVGIAGSIGIIGIACVLAFSAGIKGYIASMQDDMLSGNPITIQQTAFDLSAITKMMNTEDKVDIIKHPNQVYISSVIEHLVKTSDTLDSMMVENEITQEYIDYVKAMPQEYYNALVLGYGLDLNKTVFTDFFETSDSAGRHMSLKQVMDIYKSVLSDTDYKDLVSLIDRLAPNLAQSPTNKQYITHQYEIVAGEIADEADEVMLVLDANDELSDLLLAKLGYFSQAELLEVINKASAEDENGYNKALYRDYFSYEELLGKTFTWYPTDSLFSTEEIIQTNPITGEEKVITKHNYKGEFDTAGEGLTLRVTGILTPNDSISYGVLTSGIYYTEALTEYILQVNAESDFVNYLIGDESKAEQMLTGFTYDFDYVPHASMADGKITGERATKENENVFSFATRESIARNLGGNSLANSIKIYPISFDDKNLVTQYLEQWNNENISLTVNGVEITGDKRQEVTYTDTLELIINMINTMIDVVSYALIAFTSISLVVSTVMIGIITYVSVVERIKEIGVIRSLGGRKRDVSALFNAETFIIGLLAGLIGVFATYGISLIVNLILAPIINYPNIAALPLDNAVILVVLSILLTSISGLLPARSAARKDPVVALRTE